MSSTWWHRHRAKRLGSLSGGCLHHGFHSWAEQLASSVGALGFLQSSAPQHCTAPTRQAMLSMPCIPYKMQHPLPVPLPIRKAGQAATVPPALHSHHLVLDMLLLVNMPRPGAPLGLLVR